MPDLSGVTLAEIDQLVDLAGFCFVDTLELEGPDTAEAVLDAFFEVYTEWEKARA